MNIPQNQSWGAAHHQQKNKWAPIAMATRLARPLKSGESMSSSLADSILQTKNAKDFSGESSFVRWRPRIELGRNFCIAVRSMNIANQYGLLMRVSEAGQKKTPRSILQTVQRSLLLNTDPGRQRTTRHERNFRCWWWCRRIVTIRPFVLPPSPWLVGVHK